MTKSEIRQGDLVLSKSGRDKGQVFLVVSKCGQTVYLVDGKVRKINAQKKKNVKHLEKFSNVSYNELAMKIDNGEAVGNKRIYLLIRAEKQKIQED